LANPIAHTAETVQKDNDEKPYRYFFNQQT